VQKVLVIGANGFFGDAIVRAPERFPIWLSRIADMVGIGFDLAVDCPRGSNALLPGEGVPRSQLLAYVAQ